MFLKLYCRIFIIREAKTVSRLYYIWQCGYNFDITNSPAYDQTYIKDREIFENISELVDEIFNTYIRREGNIEPLFAEFCDGGAL